MESWKNELYHHGILGMKWGKKNGPPYPLASSDHSAAEKKAGWRKSLDENAHEDYKRAHSNKPVSQMSDSELQRVNNRLQAEANYKRLTAQQKQGTSFINSVIKGAFGNKRTSEVIGTAVGKTGSDYAKKMLGVAGVGTVGAISTKILTEAFKNLPR